MVEESGGHFQHENGVRRVVSRVVSREVSREVSCEVSREVDSRARGAPEHIQYFVSKSSRREFGKSSQ